MSRTPNFTRLFELRRVRTLPALLSLTACLSVVNIPYCHAQGANGANSSQPSAPAIADIKFKDRLYERGGPNISDTKSGKTITAVIIEGNKSVSDHNILSHMQSREDRQFDQSTFSRDIGELYRTGFFQKVEPYFTETEDGVEIRLRVTEKPTIKSVVFHGNRALDDKKLLKYCGFSVGDPMSPHVVLAARNRLEEFYRSEGFNHADIQVYKGDKPNDRDIVYRISEGELDRVNKIRIVGNVAFSTEVLKTKIKTHDSNRFLPGLTTYIGNKAVIESLDQDKDRLVNYYRSLGYFDARLDHILSYDESGKWVNVTFVISEGERYSVRNVSIQGNRYYPTERIDPFLELKPNSQFVQVKKDHDEKFLRDAYGAAGFIFADVVAQVRYLPDNKVDIVYTIEEGDVYRASDVIVHIQGDSSRTKERVVLVQLGDVRPGQVINSVAVENAERRLGYSSIFETNPSQGPPPRIEIKPVVDETFRMN